MFWHFATKTQHNKEKIDLGPQFLRPQPMLTGILFHTVVSQSTVVQGVVAYPQQPGSRRKKKERLQIAPRSKCTPGDLLLPKAPPLKVTNSSQKLNPELRIMPSTGACRRLFRSQPQYHQSALKNNTRLISSCRTRKNDKWAFFINIGENAYQQHND